MEDSVRRERRPPSRLGVAPLSTGREPLYRDDAVLAPCAGYAGLWPGRVRAVNLQSRTVDVKFDDGDSDAEVPVSMVRHAAGADAVIPRIRAGVPLQVRPRRKKLRLARRLPVSKDAAETRPWAHCGFVSMTLQPPPPGKFPYDDLPHRMILKYRWAWEDEDIPTVWPSSRVAEVTLHAIVNTVPSPYQGMHVAALRHFAMELAGSAAKPPSVLAHVFGVYDPAL